MIGPDRRGATERATTSGDGEPDAAAGGDRRTLLKRLAASPGLIASVARQAATAESPGGARPGEWTVREVVAHLAAVETVVHQARLDQLAAGGTPEWAWTEPGPSDDPLVTTLEGALDLFAARRSGTVARVAALDETGWARYGIHATFGRLDVAGLLAVLLDHDDEHRAGLEARLG